jgi:DNA helicase IV
MIYKATNIINDQDIKVPYKYIIVDEFQDMGIGRYNLINALIEQNNASIFAV